MNPKISLMMIFCSFVGGGVFYTSTFLLPEGKQAIITQFGRPVGSPLAQSGLYFKLPWIQKVCYLDKRILSWDGHPNQIPTKDKKYIIVDTTARWRIIDALKFIQTVQNERGAQARLGGILDAITRDTISNHNLVEAVRNTNDILELSEKLKAQQREKEIIEEEITGEIEKITKGREMLSSMIAKLADQELRSFGISIIDVQLRRIEYESSVEQKVYERMISERKKIAEKIRSIGKGEQARIQGRMSRDLQKIESEAYRKAQEYKGKAEAEVASIYKKALVQGSKFYEFIRTLEAYEKSFQEGSQVILSTDSDFFKLFHSGM